MYCFIIIYLIIHTEFIRILIKATLTIDFLDLLTYTFV